MKTLHFIIAFSLLAFSSLKADEPVILIYSNQVIGSPVSFALTSLDENTMVDIDWGNGILIEKEIGSGGEYNISGELAGESIKIFGAGISNIRTENMEFDSVDFSRAVDIVFISLESCQLKSIKIPENKNLNSLWLKNNSLERLDISNATALEFLNCSENSLFSLDVKDLLNLNHLDVHKNQLQSVDLSGNSKLVYLDCNSNLLDDIDLDNNDLLEILNCSDNELKVLKTSNNPDLTELHCYQNKISALNLTNNVKLRILNCHRNLFEEIDISFCQEIRELYISFNQIKYVDLASNKKLLYFHCSYNNLQKLELDENTGLRELRCANNNLTLASLPEKKDIWTTYVFAPQKKLILPKESYEVLEPIDLSEQYSRNGLYTDFEWVSKEGTVLVKGTDYTERDGIFSFLVSQNDSVYCQLENEAFPGLILQTSMISILQDGTGIPGDHTKLKATCYPNPMSDFLNIESQEPIIFVEVYSISGLKIAEFKVSEQKKITIPTSTLESGVKVIRIHRLNSAENFLLIKQ